MSLPVAPGDVVGGKYVIDRLLGQGGMGAVFVAHQEQLNRRVAIKFLLPEVAVHPEARARFEREARSAASLQSDHVCKVHDVGQLDSGTPYMVIELLEGEDLASVLEKNGPLPIAKAVKVILDACDAIGEAHSLGIIHRDLKPANLFLSRKPSGATTTKVLDFGISKAATTAQGGSLTATSAVMGSPLYMSPEQLREMKTVDGRADIWSLAITLYELVTGTTPFEAQTMADISSRILTTEPAPMRALRPDVPVALDVVVRQCLVKDVAGRLATVQELVEALQSITPPPDASDPSVFSRRSAPSLPSISEGGDTAPLRSVRIVSNTSVDAVSATQPLTPAARERGLKAPLAVAAVVLTVAAIAVGVRAWQPTSASLASAVPALPSAPPTPPPVPSSAQSAAPPAATAVAATPATSLETPSPKPAQHAATPRPHPAGAAAPKTNPLDLSLKH
jgi:serine/threonine-protein kinase